MGQNISCGLLRYLMNLSSLIKVDSFVVIIRDAEPGPVWPEGYYQHNW